MGGVHNGRVMDHAGSFNPLRHVTDPLNVGAPTYSDDERQEPVRLPAVEDVAAQRDGQHLAWALGRQRAAAQAAAVPHGACLNCEQPLPGAAVYCDADCRAEHERRELVLRRQGRAARGGA